MTAAVPATTSQVPSISTLSEADLIKSINDKVSSMLVSYRASVNYALEVGELLKEAKARVGHGNCKKSPAEVLNMPVVRKSLRKDSEPVRDERRPAGTPGSVPLGNALSTNVGKGGPGTGRTVYHTGYQDVHGAPNPGNPRPKGPDIWTEFPPNIGGRLGGRR